MAVKGRAGSTHCTTSHILPAGKRVLKRAPGPFTGVLPQALAKLDTKTLKRLDEDLVALIAVLATNRHAANIPLGR